MDQAAVAGEDVVEETVVAVAPEVEALLRVADVEKGAAAGGVLDDFVDQVGDDLPLRAAGVLEFVEEPVVVLPVEAEVHELAGLGIDALQGRAGTGRGEQVGEIGEGEAAGTPDELIVAFVVGLQDAVDALGVLEGAVQVVPDDGLEAVGEGGAEAVVGNDPIVLAAAALQGAATGEDVGGLVQGPGEQGVEFFLDGIDADLGGGGFEIRALGFAEVVGKRGEERVGQLVPVRGGVGLPGAAAGPDGVGTAPEGGIRRFKVEGEEAVDEVGDDALDAALLLPVGGLLEGMPEFVEFGAEFAGAVDDAVADFVAHAGLGGFVEQAKAAAEAEFEGKGGDDPVEEAVEGL